MYPALSELIFDVYLNASDTSVADPSSVLRLQVTDRETEQTHTDKTDD